MLQALIPLLVVVAIAYAIVTAIRKRGSAIRDDVGEVGSLKRVFTYAMLFAALIVSAVGLTGTLGMLLSNADARRGSELAGPLAMAVVGVPVFALLARWVWRTHATDRTERASSAWILYLNLSLLTTLAVSIGYAFGVARMAIDTDWEGQAASGLVVWAGAWAGHWLAARRLRPAERPEPYLWFASSAGLWICAGATGVVITNLIQRAFDSGVDTAVSPSDRDLKIAACGVAIGGIVWAWHWLVQGLGARRTQGWYGYVLLSGVLAGLVAAVVGAGLGIYLALEWWLGDPSATTARTHFRDLAPAIAMGVVGLSAWAYHRTVVKPGASVERTEVDRTYDYLLSGVALGTICVAIVMLVLAFFRAISPAPAAGDNPAATNTLLAAVTLLLVGVPMWLFKWSRIQRTVRPSAEEATAISRRVYLFGILGVGGAIAFGALIALLIVVFQAILDETDRGPLAEDLKVPVALLVTIGAAALYHWLVYRSERHLAIRQVRRDILLVGDGVIDVDLIAARTHAKVRVLHRLDLPAGTVPDTNEIVDTIQHSQGEHLLVLAGVDGVRVIPYE